MRSRCTPLVSWNSSTKSTSDAPARPRARSGRSRRTSRASRNRSPNPRAPALSRISKRRAAMPESTLETAVTRPPSSCAEAKNAARRCARGPFDSPLTRSRNAQNASSAPLGRAGRRGLNNASSASAMSSSSFSAGNSRPSAAPRKQVPRTPCLARRRVLGKARRAVHPLPRRRHEIGAGELGDGDALFVGAVEERRDAQPCGAEAPPGIEQQGRPARHARAPARAPLRPRLRSTRVPPRRRGSRSPGSARDLSAELRTMRPAKPCKVSMRACGIGERRFGAIAHRARRNGRRAGRLRPHFENGAVGERRRVELVAGHRRSTRSTRSRISAAAARENVVAAMREGRTGSDASVASLWPRDVSPNDRSEYNATRRKVFPVPALAVTTKLVRNA